MLKQGGQAADLKVPLGSKAPCMHNALGYLLTVELRAAAFHRIRN
jgi:hypothetical protein